MRATKIILTLSFVFSLVSTVSATNMDGGLLPSKFGHWYKLIDGATGVMYRVDNQLLQGRKNIVFVCQYGQINIADKDVRIAKIFGDGLFRDEHDHYIVSDGLKRDPQQEVTWVISGTEATGESTIYVKKLIEPTNKGAFRCRGSVQ